MSNVVGVSQFVIFRYSSTLCYERSSSSYVLFYGLICSVHSIVIKVPVQGALIVTAFFCFKGGGQSGWMTDCSIG